MANGKPEMESKLFKQILLNFNKVTQCIIAFTSSLVRRHRKHLHLQRRLKVRLVARSALLSPRWQKSIAHTSKQLNMRFAAIRYTTTPISHIRPPSRYNVNNITILFNISDRVTVVNDKG